MNPQQQANQRQAWKESKHSSRDDSNTSNSSHKQLPNIILMRCPVSVNNNHAKHTTMNSETRINPNLTQTVITAANQDIVNGNVLQRKGTKLKKRHYRTNDGNKRNDQITTPNFVMSFKFLKEVHKLTWGFVICFQKLADKK